MKIYVVITQHQSIKPRHQRNIMEILQTIGYFILAIFPLVIIHELGHFLAAKLTGTRADVFSIGMGPRLFGWNKITGFTFGKLPENWDGDGCTDYRLALLPIGGYVKILGMVDESFDSNYAGQPSQPWEFRSKNAWQKAFMISAGVIMNILLAIGILWAINSINGKTILITKKVGYVESSSPFSKAGIMAGDEITSVNGKPTTSFDDALTAITIDEFGKDVQIEVQRDNSTPVNFSIKSKDIADMMQSKSGFGLYPEGVKVLFTAVETTKPAGKAGFKANDTVATVNGIACLGVQQFMDIISSNKNKSVDITVKRANELKTIAVTPSEEGKIGVGVATVFTGDTKVVHYGFFEAIQVGFRQMITYTKMFISSVAMMIKGEQSFKQSAGGPIMIAKMANQSAEMGYSSFFTFMATLSITLAVMNILPIPALDGGHLVFIIIEGILRREVSIKVKMAFQQSGVILLLLLMAFVFYNDLTR